MILFDYSHSLHRTARMNVDAINENVNITGHLILTQITSYARKLGASKTNPFVICMDSKPSWRHDYYLENRHKFDDLKDKTYKGNRVTDTTLPWEKMHEVSDSICRSLEESSDFYVLRVDKCEADDIIAILAKKYSELGEEVWVVSSDKDFVQLQSNLVKIYDPLKQAFKPEQDVDLYKIIHVIIGDTVDNIPAIKPKTKEITAMKMLKDLDTLLATNPLMRERYKFNEELILFENIPTHLQSSVFARYDGQKFNYNPMALMKAFGKFGLAKHIEGINAFKFTDTVVNTKINQTFESAKRNAQLAQSNLEDFFS